MIKSSMNTNTFIQYKVYFILASLTLILLALIILLCSSYRRKKKILLNVSSRDSDNGLFANDNYETNGNKRVDVPKSNGTKKYSNDKGKHQSYLCCLNSSSVSSSWLNDERVQILGKDNHMNVDMRNNNLKEENIIRLSVALPESRHELSHVDRVLPSLPLIVNQLDYNIGDSESIVEDSLVLPLPYVDLDNLLYTKCSFQIGPSDSLTCSSNKSPVNSNRFGSTNFRCEGCCCGNNIGISSIDDLSSAEYDPTYAAIKRVKVSCHICGAPSVYTPANSNRNSNLSLQLNSCLVSPVRYPKNKFTLDSLNSSTYASIVKISNNNSNGPTYPDGDGKLALSILQRQRSISQGDIDMESLKQKRKGVSDSSEFNDKKEREDITIAAEKVASNFMSLWSLAASHRNSPFNIFPIIPERTYGQSVLDLVNKLRTYHQGDPSNLVQSSVDSNIGRGFSPPILFDNSVNRRNSPAQLKGRDWSTPSCSPSKLIGHNSKYPGYDYDFPDTLGKTSMNSLNVGVKNSSKKGFQPVLSPPLSPMDGVERDKDSQLNAFQGDESKFENHSFFNSEKRDNNIEDHGIQIYSGKRSKDFEYLPDSIELCQQNLSFSATENLLSFSNANQTLPVRPRPISIVLCNNDVVKNDRYFNSRFDNLECFDMSNAQTMSPLMELSLENSSSKTTLSSLGYPQLTRLISSEDSCAKSPPSAGPSPSLEKSKFSQFVSNKYLWTNCNPIFDNYETF